MQVSFTVITFPIPGVATWRWPLGSNGCRWLYRWSWYMTWIAISGVCMWSRGICWLRRLIVWFRGDRGWSRTARLRGCLRGLGLWFSIGGGCWRIMRRRRRRGGAASGIRCRWTNKNIILSTYHMNKMTFLITEYRRKLTISKSSFHIISRGFRLTSKVQSIGENIVTVCLIPVQHLLRAFSTCIRVTFTPHWRFGRGQRSATRRVRYAASVSLMIHVGLATTISQDNTVSIRWARSESASTYPSGIY